MPFPYSEPYEEDIFDPDYEPPAEGEEEDDYNEYAVRPLTAPMDTETLHNLYMGSQGLNRLPPEPYERGIIDSPEYWMSDQMLGAGSMRPQMQEWDRRGSVGPPPTPEEPWTRPGADGRGPVREAAMRPAPVSTEQELDMVQQAMAPRGPFERGDRPGRPSGEGGGGGGGLVPRNDNDARYRQGTQREAIPQKLEDVLSAHAQGSMSPRDVQNAFRREGWGVNLRRRGSVEIFTPEGRSIIVPNDF